MLSLVLSIPEKPASVPESNSDNADGKDLREDELQNQDQLSWEAGKQDNNGCPATFEPTLKCFCTQRYLAASSVPLPGYKLTQSGIFSALDTSMATPKLKQILMLWT